MRKKLLSALAICTVVALVCGFTSSYANACPDEPDAPLIAVTEDNITAKKLSKPDMSNEQETGSSPESETSEALVEAEKYAYLDYESASPEIKEKILEARNQIIYSESWTADGMEGYVVKYPSFEIIEKVPEFHDIFPADWDIPSVAPTVLHEETKLNDTPISYNSEQANLDWELIDTYPVYLEKASNVANAEPFGAVYMDPETVGTAIMCGCAELTSSKTCNIGFTDVSTGYNLFFKEYLNPGEGIVLFNVGYRTIAFRASTHSIPGWSTMAALSALRFVEVR